MLGGGSGPDVAAAPQEVTYRVEQGLRHVEPYNFDFTTFAKKRWVGKGILEVFVQEFVAYSEAYYRGAIEDGRVTVDGCRVPICHILQDGEKIVHRAVLCRENPVLDRGPIRVVAETGGLLVIDKPSSLPIHACGAYRFNSLIPLLRAQLAVAADVALRTTHRLDRLTSGLVLLAKTKDTAQQISCWFAQNRIRKTYLARVRGSFPHLLRRAEDSASTLPAGASMVAPGRLRVEGFNVCVDHKVGKYEFSALWPGEDGEPKDAATEFECIGSACDDSESIVRCFPLSGRTHQIRVHLRHLGHPIANDSSYGGELRDDPALPLIAHVRQTDSRTAAGGAEADDVAADEPPLMHPSGIFLHALAYSLPGSVTYTTAAPEWATLD